MAQCAFPERTLLKTIRSACAAVALICLGSAAGCDQPPESTPLGSDEVRWIVPAAPGGGYDTLSRLIEPFYEEALGVRITVENIAGAASILGANSLKRAEPDGRTVGLLNAPGLLTSALTGRTEAPDLTTDFAILGRVMVTEQILATATNSSFRSMDDVLAAARERPILYGMTEVGGTNFVGIAVTSLLLDIDIEYVSGFRSSQQVVLAAIRGEVDLIGGTFGSKFRSISEGDLRPVLQLAAERISQHPCLDGVPLLGGDSGLAVRRAAELGRSVEEADALAEAFERVCRTGRVVAAPRGLEPDVYEYLEEGLTRALTDPGFVRAAANMRYPVKATRGPNAYAELQAAVEAARRLVPAVTQAIEKVREP
jgi:tripartite-type tricarboxylate transporter receptor subunit TctC